MDLGAGGFSAEMIARPITYLNSTVPNLVISLRGRARVYSVNGLISAVDLVNLVLQ